MNMQGIDEIDDLLREYELQEREVYINRTIPAINKLEDIANRLADAYKKQYRANPTYENEERMRYWRYMGAKLWNSKSDGMYYTPYRAYTQRKKEYDDLIRQHTEASEQVDEKLHENPNARDKKNIHVFAIFLGLSIVINVFIHILFILASSPQ